MFFSFLLLFAISWYLGEIATFSRNDDNNNGNSGIIVVTTFNDKKVLLQLCVQLIVALLGVPFLPFQSAFVNTFFNCYTFFSPKNKFKYSDVAIGLGDMA